MERLRPFHLTNFWKSSSSSWSRSSHQGPRRWSHRSSSSSCRWAHPWISSSPPGSSCGVESILHSERKMFWKWSDENQGWPICRYSAPKRRYKWDIFSRFRTLNLIFGVKFRTLNPWIVVSSGSNIRDRDVENMHLTLTRTEWEINIEILFNQ